MAKQYRIPYYQKITCSLECKLALPVHWGVTAGVELTKQWYDAPHGNIEIPSEDDEIIGTHAVTIVGYNDAKGRFKFSNSWGTAWGDEGYGSLPYEALDSRPFDAWVVGPPGQSLPGKPAKGIVFLAWSRTDFAERTFHVHDIYDADMDERIGWAFALQTEDHLAVEELYVRPQYRRRGFATKLLESLGALASREDLPLLFFIPFGDYTPQLRRRGYATRLLEKFKALASRTGLIRRSKPNNSLAVERLFSKAGYCLHPTELPWSPFGASL
jgi:GNAT superfamily N-acetyltransferase